MTLTREELEEFLERIGSSCVIAKETPRYFILTCGKREKHEVQKRIVEELGYPASITGRREVAIYREKPEAKMQAMLSRSPRKATLMEWPGKNQWIELTYEVPEICFKGSGTYHARSVLKQRGFKFYPGTREWCKDFNSVTELKRWIEEELPSVVEEASTKGVTVEVDTDELLSEADRLEDALANWNKVLLRGTVSELASRKLPADAIASLLEAADYKRFAEEIKKAASVFDKELGEAVTVYAVRGATTGTSAEIEVCVIPREWLGRERYKAFARLAESLGMRKEGNAFCKPLGLTTPELWRVAAKVAELAGVEGDPAKALEEARKALTSSPSIREVDEEKLKEAVDKINSFASAIADRAMQIIKAVLP